MQQSASVELITATHLQHTATHCNALQQTATTHCNSYDAPRKIPHMNGCMHRVHHCNTHVQHTATTLCNTLQQQTAPTHCNTYDTPLKFPNTYVWMCALCTQGVKHCSTHATHCNNTLQHTAITHHNNTLQQHAATHFTHLERSHARINTCRESITAAHMQHTCNNTLQQHTLHTLQHTAITHHNNTLQQHAATHITHLERSHARPGTCMESNLLLPTGSPAMSVTLLLSPINKYTYICIYIYIYVYIYKYVCKCEMENTDSYIFSHAHIHIHTYIHIHIYICVYTHTYMYVYKYVSAHGGDHTKNIWISRSNSFPVRSFECRGLHLLTWKFAWNFGDFRVNVFDMYGDSRENSFENLAVVIIFSPISSVCAYAYLHTFALASRSALTPPF